MEIIKEFFSHLYNFEELIRWGGLFILIAIVYAETGLLAGFFLPGDSLLVTAGLIAGIGDILNIYALLLLLPLAAIAGDNTGYWLGRHFGPRIFNREDSLLFHKDHLKRTQKFYDKYGVKTIIIARFVPIVRTFAPTVAGVGKMKYSRYLLFSVLGGVLWIWSMCLCGYFLGRSIPHIEKKIHWVILIVIFLSFIPIFKELFHIWQEKKKKTAG
jgi:membrane-associated protein